MLSRQQPGVVNACGGDAGARSAAPCAPAAHHAPRLALRRRAAPALWPSTRCRAAPPDGDAGGGGGGGGAPDRAALLARIEAAKKYKGGGGAPAPPSPPPAGGGGEAESTEQRRAAWEAELRAKEAAARGDGAYSALLTQIEAGQAQEPEAERGQPARPDFYTNPDGPDASTLWENSVRAQAPGRGSANEMASWMRGVYSEESGKMSDGISPNLRPEEFTQQLEARQRAMGADIITSAVPGAEILRGLPSQAPGQPQPRDAGAGGAGAADRADSAGGEGAAAAAGEGREGEEGEGEGGAYQPKVTTWGVFPRPSNISQAYGGGRNIKPGQELETKEQKAKREAEYAASLQRYKQLAGLADLDPGVVAAAEARYAVAMKMLTGGQQTEALAIFNEVRDSVPLKTRIGGLATLQAAICYDGLGDGQQAQALYKRLKGHPSGEVGRKARHLVFGFQAMEFLKAQDTTYKVDKKAYDPYFRRFAQNRVYVASEEERAADEAASRAATLVAAGVLLGPVAAFAAFALSR